MNPLKTIWHHTFLGKLFASDPILARILSCIFILYIFIHIFRLELYPMYMFAMFSKQEQPRELYHTFNVFDKEKKLNLNDFNFRDYTVLMNTIGQYDAILNNDMNHPEAEAIDKFIDRLHLQNTGLKEKLKGNFSFYKSELEEELGLWLGNKLNVKPQNLKIEKAAFRWEEITPALTSKTIIYGQDR